MDSWSRDWEKWTDSSEGVLFAEPPPGARDEVPIHRWNQQLSGETEAQAGSGLPKGPQQSWDVPPRPVWL